MSPQRGEVRTRGGAKLKGGKGELVNRLKEIIVGPVDAQVVHGDDGLVDCLVVYMHVAEAKLVYQPGVEKMSLGDAEETIVHRQVEREIKICLADGATQGRGQTTRSEGQHRLEIGKEKAR